MRTVVSLKINAAAWADPLNPGKELVRPSDEEACTIANATLGKGGTFLNMSVRPLDYDQVVVDRDLLHELRAEVESAWWNCNGGKLSHQAYIDTLVKLGEALGEPCTHTPSGQPLKDGQAP